MRRVERPRFFRAGRQGGRVQTPPSGLRQGRGSLSERLRPNDQASDERAKLFFLSFLPTQDANPPLRGSTRQGVSLGEPRDYTELGAPFCSWVVPRPFDPCPLSTSGVLSHLRGFATIRLPLQRFPLLQGAMPWPRCWKVPGWD